MEHPPSTMFLMDFGKRVAALRKERGLTQQALADRVGVHVSQVHRYESGVALPAFDILKALAVALKVSADLLVFDKDERGPDDDLRLQFEAVAKFSKDEKKVVKALLEGLILKHEAQRWAETR